MAYDSRGGWGEEGGISGSLTGSGGRGGAPGRVGSSVGGDQWQGCRSKER